jgi:hypothetical protein
VTGDRSRPSPLLVSYGAHRYDGSMHPRARRAVSFALSLAVHLLLILELYSLALVKPGFPELRPLPVKIIEPQARPKPAPKPAQVAKAAPPAVAAPKPIEEPPPPAAPAPEPPQRKLPLPEQQVVSPPDAGKNEPPPETRLLSDRDNRVDQQTVKRGNPAPGESAPGEKPQPPQAPKAKANKAPDGRGGPVGREPPPKVAALPGLDRLMPDALHLAEEGYGSAADGSAGQQVAQAEQQPRRFQPRGADGLWIPSSGPLGTLDFLPDVKEGDITLLNTKAEVFAPFVRRVAVRVFQNFLILVKRDILSSGIPTVEQVEAEAVMDASGNMVEFTINRRSSRIALASDRRLQQACNDGFFDRNPPPGARAKDGRIHFILETALQSVPTPHGTNGWVQLSAGLL